MFFSPKTIAVIGATSDPKKFGNAVTVNILKNKNLQSEVFLVSLNNKEIDDIECYKFLSDVPKDVDLAIILVPARIVEVIIDQCIKKKVKRVIIVTAGFGEIDDLGKKVEIEIAKKCNKAGIRVMGPNCVGIQNLDIGLNASFIQTPCRGNVSIISQSGSIGCACFYEMDRWFLGCSKFANIGNDVDISFKEILAFYKDDINTKIVAIYAEAIKDGKGVYEVLKEVTQFKPVIVLKGGTSPMGMTAASSHTGSIAMANNKVLNYAFRQAGAIICESISDLITAMKIFSFLPLPKGDKIGVLTNSGGNAVLFSDYAENFNLPLAEFSEQLIEKISPYLIPLVKKVNPLDMIAGAAEEQYFQITKTMLEDPGINIVVACVVIPPFLEMKSDEHYRGIIRAWNETGRDKPLISLITFGDNFNELKELAKKENATFFITPHDAAYAAKLLIDRMKFTQKLKTPDIKI